MKTKAMLVAMMGAWLGLTAAVSGAEDEKLKILAKYVGKWDSTLKVGDSEDELKATVVTRRVLDGNYVQETSTVVDEAGEERFSVMALMGYDAEAGEYRKWTFTSGGRATQEKGVWDPETKTMTWTGTDPKTGNTTTISATFKGKDEEHWSIVTETSSGEMRGLITGVNRRVKKAE